MKKLFILFVTIILTFSSCNSPTENNIGDDQELPTIKQGVWGYVKFWEGDFMPQLSSGGTTSVGGKITPVKRQILIYQLTPFTKVEQVNYSPFYRKINTDLITTDLSNSKGFFQIKLPEGKYSIFIKEDSLLYSNGGDGEGNIFPFTIKKDSLTQLEFDITYKATF